MLVVDVLKFVESNRHCRELPSRCGELGLMFTIELDNVLVRQAGDLYGLPTWTIEDNALIEISVPWSGSSSRCPPHDPAAGELVSPSVSAAASATGRSN